MREAFFRRRIVEGKHVAGRTLDPLSVNVVLIGLNDCFHTARHNCLPNSISGENFAIRVCNTPRRAPILWRVSATPHARIDMAQAAEQRPSPTWRQWLPSLQHFLRHRCCQRSGDLVPQWRLLLYVLKRTSVRLHRQKPCLALAAPSQATTRLLRTPSDVCRYPPQYAARRLSTVRPTNRAAPARPG